MLHRALALLLALVLAARGHDGLDLGEPSSPQDAWSVLKLCNGNIGELIAGQQWIEISIHWQVGWAMCPSRL